jgi:hypothetical protein
MSRTVVVHESDGAGLHGDAALLLVRPTVEVPQLQAPVSLSVHGG